MEFLFYGAGVLGSLYAARLAEGGHTVTMLARGRRLAELRQSGIVLEHAFSGRRTVTSVGVVEALAPDDRYDWIVVLVRKNQLPGVLPELAANHATPNILIMVNNPSGYGRWREAVGDGRLAVGFAGAGGTREEGVVRYALAPGLYQPTTLGEPDGHVTPRLITLRRALMSAGFPAAISWDMAAWQKTHLAWVGALAGGVYMGEAQGVRLRESRAIWRLTAQAIREGFDVLHALDVPVTPRRLHAWEWPPVPLLVEGLRLWSGTRHFEVFVRAHSLAARDEMTQLADDFSALARQSGVETPALDRLRTFYTMEADRTAHGRDTGARG